MLELHHVWRLLAPPRLAGVMDVCLDVAAGKQLALVGPSGAGKSTLLRMIAGLDKPDRGRIHIAGRDVTDLPPHERDVGFVAQRPALYPQLTVAENLAVGLELRPKRERPNDLLIRQRVEEAGHLLGITALFGRRPHQLSGGEQKRASLGRLLVRRPRIWLLDEPFAHLDLPLQTQLRRDILLLRERFLPTIVAVTHDPVEALSSGDRLAVLIRGRIRQMGDPNAVLAKPNDRRVAGFLGSPPMNLAIGVLVRPKSVEPALQFAAADGAFHLPVPAELVTHGAEGQPVTVGIGPEAMTAIPENEKSTEACVEMPGWIVREVSWAPPMPLVHVACGSVDWRFWSRDPVPPCIGSTVTLRVRRDLLHWFDRRGRRIALPSE